MTAPATLPPPARRAKFPRRTVPDPAPAVPLRDGDRLTADEFLRRYDAMPPGFRAELIDGKVCVPMPVRNRLHGDPLSVVVTWLGVYRGRTPGTSTATDATTVLGDDDVPQPDAMLRVLPECGGRTADTADDLIAGGPEFLAEVSASSVRADTGTKRAAYLAAGVREYLVLRTEDAAVDWFVLRGGRYEPLTAADGLLRSEAFPGLWLNAAALLRRDMAAVLDSLNDGLASAEHAAFAAGLSAKLAE